VEQQQGRILHIHPWIIRMSTIQQRVSVNKIDFQIPEALKRYSSDNFMGGVDNMDEDKKNGGSFASRALF
jgi:hypothetical protein